MTCRKMSAPMIFPRRIWFCTEDCSAPNIFRRKLFVAFPSSQARCIGVWRNLSVGSILCLPLFTVFTFLYGIYRCLRCFFLCLRCLLLFTMFIFAYGVYLCLRCLPLFTVFTFVYGVYLSLRCLPHLIVPLHLLKYLNLYQKGNGNTANKGKHCKNW